MFDSSMVNEPLGFQPLKFYCIFKYSRLKFKFSNKANECEDSEQLAKLHCLISVFMAVYSTVNDSVS